jgi:hypothetical protein
MTNVINVYLQVLSKGFLKGTGKERNVAGVKQAKNNSRGGPLWLILQHCSIVTISKAIQTNPQACLRGLFRLSDT